MELVRFQEDASPVVLIIQRAKVLMEKDFETNKTAHELGIDGLSDEEGMSAQERLSNDLVPLFWMQLKKLLSYIPLADAIEHLHNPVSTPPLEVELTFDEFQQLQILYNFPVPDIHTANVIEWIRYTFESFERTLDLIEYFHAQSRDVSKVEGYEKEAQMFMFQHFDHFLELIHNQLRSLFVPYHRFWNAPQPQVMLQEKIQVIHWFELVCDEIREIYLFFNKPIHDATFRRFQAHAHELCTSLSYTDIKPEKNPAVPVIKLCRLLLNKVSRQTSSTHVILRQMVADELVDLDQSVEHLFSITEGLRSNVYMVLDQNGERESMVENFHHPCIAVDIFRTFDEFRKTLNKFLTSPPPEADQTLIKVMADWLQVWFNQFCQALRNLVERVCITLDLVPDQLDSPFVDYFTRIIY